ncbi:MAG: class 1 fructose-bisphosphatase [Hyphomicrobiales bacterium]
MKTLIEFINEKQNEFPFATGEFSRLLHDISIAAKIVNREVNRAGLANILGYEGHTNVQGEDQKKLDVYANEQFIRALKNGHQCAAVISEEDDEVVVLKENMNRNSRYIVAIDPLDGSSNIEVNVPIGTIFAIYRRKTSGPVLHDEDILQAGTELIAAGYVVYGSSTMLVYSTGHGVHGFTLDPTVGLFFLSNPNVKMPEDGTMYSINEAGYIHFPDGVKRLIKYFQEDDESTSRPYKTRYIGSLVSDFHRNMIYGGIFMYPGNYKTPLGKLRLMYECIPVAFLAEQAGGLGSDGFKRILEIKPDHIHQRTPFFVGSKNLVLKAEEFMRKYSSDFSKEIEAYRQKKNNGQ